MLNKTDYNCFSDLFSVEPNTINHLNWKIFIIVGILQVLKIEFLKLRILEILNFHPCYCGCYLPHKHFLEAMRDYFLKKSTFLRGSAVVQW